MFFFEFLLFLCVCKYVQDIVKKKKNTGTLSNVSQIGEEANIQPVTHRRLFKRPPGRVRSVKQHFDLVHTSTLDQHEAGQKSFSSLQVRGHQSPALTLRRISCHTNGQVFRSPHSQIMSGDRLEQSCELPT